MNNIRIQNNLKMESNKVSSANASEFQRYDSQWMNNSRELNNQNQGYGHGHGYPQEYNSSTTSSSMIPKWKIPLSKSYTSSSIQNKNQYLGSDEESSSYSYGDANSSNEENRMYGSYNDGRSDNQNGGDSSPYQKENEEPTEEPTSVIQILLPCIICNRTFSPEALERHSKICTKVNVNDVRIKHPRPQFDSARARIKDTKLELFIKPTSDDERSPITPTPTTPGNDWGSNFTRGGRGRSSFQDRTNTTRFNFSRGSVGTGSMRGVPSSWKRSGSVPRSEYGEFDDTASSINMDHDATQPSYSRTLSPTEDCPYCGRSFGLKAFDRHVNHCKEIWERKQYEIQPTPKEIEIARLRQEIRTKYRPMKGSSSLTSLRSFTSPSKDFATNALNKLFGGLKRVENINLHGRPGAAATLTGFKQSNESLASSCYGEFPRAPNNQQSRRRNPSSPGSMMTTSMVSPSSHTGSKPMRPGTLRTSNSGSNIPQYITTPSRKSTENLAQTPSSGYGPGGSYMSSFGRNSLGRSSLNKNYFLRNSALRAEPEGTEHNTYENTSSPSYMSSLYDQKSGANREQHNGPSPLIITSMNFYTKPSNPNTSSTSSMRSSSSFPVPPLRQNNSQSYGNYGNGDKERERERDREREREKEKTATSAAGNGYDPYEKAAKQLEELFRKQPPPTHNKTSSRIQRKIGLDRAFASVLGPGAEEEEEAKPNQQKKDRYTSSYSSNPRQRSLQINEDEFGDNDYYNWDEIMAGGSSTDKDEDLYRSSSKTESRTAPVPPPRTTSDGGRRPSENSNGLYSTGFNHQDSSDLLSHHRLGTHSQPLQLQSTRDTKSNDKSTRASNTSSADSAFSRSDGTDLEFEALESLLELGHLPPGASTSTGTNGGTLTNPRDSGNDGGRSNGLKSSRVSRDARRRLFTSDSAHSEDEPMAISSSSSSSTSSHHGMVMSDNNSYDEGASTATGASGPRIIEHIISTTITPSSKSQSQPQLKPTMARFCHECGTSYPTSDAKFCPECGERRVIHV